MKFRTNLLFASLLGPCLTLSCVPSDQGKPVLVLTADQISGPEDDVERILSSALKIEQGFRDGDLDAVMGEISDDIVLVPPARPILKGKSQVRLFYKTQLDKIQVVELAPSLDELVVCGDWAFSRGNAAVVARTDEHDHPVQAFNRGLEIWKKQPDGSWKLARAIGNQ